MSHGGWVIQECTGAVCAYTLCVSVCLSVLSWGGHYTSHVSVVFHPLLCVCISEMLWEVRMYVCVCEREKESDRDSWHT